MNRQTKSLKTINVSCLRARGGNNVTPTFKEFPAGKQPSKRKSKWGLKLPETKREIVYMEEHKNRRAK